MNIAETLLPVAVIASIFYVMWWLKYWDFMASLMLFRAGTHFWDVFLGLLMWAYGIVVAFTVTYLLQR